MNCPEPWCALLAADDLRSPAMGPEIEGICIAQRDQLLPGHSTAHAALAVKQNHRALVLHAARQGGFNLVEGKVDGARQMARAEFGGSADIYDHCTVLQMRLRVFH